MNIEKAIKNLTEITDLSREEINKQDKNATAVLDIVDITDLDIVLKEINSLEEENKQLKNKIRKIKNYINSLPNKEHLLDSFIYKDVKYKILELLESEDKT